MPTIHRVGSGAYIAQHDGKSVTIEKQLNRRWLVEGEKNTVPTYAEAKTVALAQLKGEATQSKATPKPRPKPERPAVTAKSFEELAAVLASAGFRLERAH